MEARTRNRFSWPAFFVAIIQFIMTQGVVFVLSFFLPIDEKFVSQHSGWFFVFLTGCYTLGVFGIGWAAVKLRWLRIAPLWVARLIGTAIGAAIPLIIGLLISRSYEPGHPAFFIAMITAVLGFYLPGWLRKR